MSPKLTPELLLQAYRIGVFPMSESRDDPEIFWVDPKLRGILPLDGLRISRSLARTIRREVFEVSFDSAFAEVIAGCADREETWINAPIASLYLDLHRSGHAHSVEVWQGAKLMGGVYGVALGGAFFGESMFSRVTDASKVALAFLIDRLAMGGYRLFDTQFTTPHLESLGAIEVPRLRYQRLLKAALSLDADFNRQGDVPSGQDVVQRNTQTS